MHYTPNGVARRDLTHVGFKFADPSSVRYEASARRAINVMFQIPPHVADYVATARYEFPRDAVLLNLTPHMHVRGKSFRYEATYPDGSRQTLLEVPRWDFNWQMDYILAEPLAIPAGTVLECTAVYDNSEANQANPDPSNWVTFGEQTWEEMLIGFFVAIEPIEQAKTSPDELAGAIEDLVQTARTPRRTDRRMDRAIELTRSSLDIVRTVGELAQIRESREVSELEHIVSTALAELEKQQVLGPEVSDDGRSERGLAFLIKSTKVLQGLAAQNQIKVTKVQPVPWPLKQEDGGDGGR
jgi:hypothetical protein